MNGPLIALRGVRKRFTTRGGIAVEALRCIDFDIEAGEFVAIVGASGSGKSTLMNILGCLDKPTEGSYRFAGDDVSGLDRDALAALRREAFGFVFQQYNLIPTATARGNVEVPAIYAGETAETRAARAAALLARLGLADRLDHRPGELSGGQQQRVSIARALMNGGQVILADEPTGALDSQSGAEVMALLTALADEGHTVILITHARGLAGTAHRIVEIADGEIVADSGPAARRARPWSGASASGDGAGWWADIGEAFVAARAALLAGPVRTTLTLLGIVIGVASVVALMAVGQGSKQVLLDRLNSLGVNQLYVDDLGRRRGPDGLLTMRDVEVVRRVDNVAAAMPNLRGTVTVRRGNTDLQTLGYSATPEFPAIKNWDLSEGVFYTDIDERRLTTVAVIGQTVRRTLFADGADAIGAYILVDNVPFRVIGVLSAKGAMSGDTDNDNMVVFPFGTGSYRVFGRPYPNGVYVAVGDLDRIDDTIADIGAALEAVRGVRDFTIYNGVAFINARAEAHDTLSLLLAATAAISLLVGGIGIMNVMLMTVRGRTREIGIRMAAGARTADILRQFLTEAVLLSGAGGILGLVIGHLAGAGATYLGMPVIFTLHAAGAAFACALAAGLVFGYAPARGAARLEPVVALARE